MKNRLEKANLKKDKKARKEFNKGRAFVKITAGVLAFLMLLATGATLIFALL